MLTQLDNLIHAYGNMEVIRLTPIPVAHLYVLKESVQNLNVEFKVLTSECL